MKRAILAIAIVLICLTAPAFADSSVAVNANAALQGNFGMQVTIDGSATDAFVQDNSPNNETIYRFSFWIRPSVGGNEIELAGNTSVRIATMANVDPGTGGGEHIVLFLRRDQPGGGLDQYMLNAWVKDVPIAGGSPTFRFGNSLFIALRGDTTPAQFEIEWQQDTNAADNVGDGKFIMRRLSPNPTTKTKSNFNTQTATLAFNIDQIKIGALQGSGVNGTGSYSFDDFVSVRTPGP